MRSLGTPGSLNTSTGSAKTTKKIDEGVELQWGLPYSEFFQSAIEMVGRCLALLVSACSTIVFASFSKSVF